MYFSREEINFRQWTWLNACFLNLSILFAPCAPPNPPTYTNAPRSSRGLFAWDHKKAFRMIGLLVLVCLLALFVVVDFSSTERFDQLNTDVNIHWHQNPTWMFVCHVEKIHPHFWLLTFGKSMTLPSDPARGFLRCSFLLVFPFRFLGAFNPGFF